MFDPRKSCIPIWFIVVSIVQPWRIESFATCYRKQCEEVHICHAISCKTKKNRGEWDRFSEAPLIKYFLEMISDIHKWFVEGFIEMTQLSKRARTELCHWYQDGREKSKESVERSCWAKDDETIPPTVMLCVPLGWPASRWFGLMMWDFMIPDVHYFSLFTYVRFWCWYCNLISGISLSLLLPILSCAATFGAGTTPTIGAGGWTGSRGTFFWVFH